MIENNKKPSKKGFLGKYLASLVAGSFPTLFFFYIILIALIIIVSFFSIIAALFPYAKSDPSTGLTYFEADTFYGLPYKASFKDGDYSSIFKEVPALYENKNTFDKEKEKINDKLRDAFFDYKFKDLIPGKCGDYCDKRIKDVYNVRLKISSTYTHDNKEYKIYNASSGKKASFITLEFKGRVDGIPRNLYYYDLLDDTIEKSSLTRGKGDNKVNYLFVKQRTKKSYYDYKTYDLQGTYPTDSRGYLFYYLKKDNLIGRLYHQKGYTDDKEILRLMIESFDAILKKDNTLKQEIIDLIKKQIKYNEDQLVQSAIVDMLNFSGINEKGMTMKDSKSNQFLLSNEKVNLDYFNNIPFGKNYKQIIVKTKDFKDINLEKAQKILKYKEDSVDEDSNEFGYIVPKQLIRNVNGYVSKNRNPILVINKDNSYPIIKISDNRFYSPSITYKVVTNGLSEFSNGKTKCSVIQPHKEKGDFVIYNQETLYTGVKVKVRCETKVKKGLPIIKYYDFKSPPIIQEAEVIYYKKFKFKSKVNKDSIRNPEDYYLNYFYQKEYINLDDNGIAKTTNKISDIYLDRKTILFKGIYLKIKGFGIEVKGNGEYVTKKKSADGYESILPEAPVKFEIGLLTDINDKEIQEAKLFKGDRLKEFEGLNEEAILRKFENGRINLKNPFFKNYKAPLYRKGKEFSQAAEIQMAKNIIDNKDRIDKQNVMLNMSLDKEVSAFKDSYFYTSVQNKKFFQVLDDIYGLKGKSDKLYKYDTINTFKKYLVFFTSIDSDPNYQYILKKKTDNVYPFKNIVNLNNESFYTLNFKNKTYHPRLFDKCYSYTFLNEVYKELYKNTDEYKNNYTNFKNELRKNKIEDDLLKACYNSYFPYLEYTIKVKNSKERIKEILKKQLGDKYDKEKAEEIYKKNYEKESKKLYEQIIKDFGDETFRTYPTDEKVLKYLNDPRYLVKVSNLAKTNEIYNMLLADKNWLHGNGDALKFKDKENLLKERIYNVFYNRDGLEKLWELYKNTDEYKASCDPKEEVLKSDVNPMAYVSNPNFKCSLEKIYSEFLDKLLQKKEYLTFIKEEYLKQNVQDEPFYHYYHDDKHVYASFLSKGYETGFSPLEDSRINSRNNMLVLTKATKSYNNSLYYEYILGQSDNTIAHDFTYSFNLDKTFSFNPENYNHNLGLHFVPLNPNLYLHSFFKNIKNGEKYKIDVYGNGFKGISQEYDKKDIEKSYISDIVNFILNKVTNKKVITDLIDIIDLNGEEDLTGYLQWAINFDETGKMYKLSQLFANSSVNNNISNYITNIKVGKKISKVTHHPFNNSTISNYDLKLITGDENLDWFFGKTTSILNRYWYSLYVLELLQDYYNTKNKDINIQLLDNADSYEELMNDLKAIQNSKDPIVRLYKETLMYAWGYLDETDFTKIPLLGNVNMFGADTAFDYLKKKPTEIYALTDTYQKYHDDELNLTDKQKEDFEKALENLSDKDYLSKIYIRNSKNILIGRNKIFTLIGLDIKKEKVLNLELYYNDFEKFIKEKNEISNKGEDYYYNLIEKQLKVIKILQRFYPEYYFKYYLNPILNDIDLSNNDLLDLKEFYDKDIAEKYKIETSLNDYNFYIELVKYGLPENDEMDSILIPYSKFRKNYTYKPGSSSSGIDNSISGLRKQFVENNNTNQIVLYHMLSDLFIFGNKTDKRETIVSLPYKEKLQIDIKLKKYYILQKEKEIKEIEESGIDDRRLREVENYLNYLENLKEGYNKKIEDTNKWLNPGGYFGMVRNRNITTVKIQKAKLDLKRIKSKEGIKKINKLKKEIENLKKSIELIQKQIDNLSEEEAERIIKYKVTLDKGTIQYEKIETDKDKEKNTYSKAIVFNGPFSGNNRIGFTIQGFDGSATDNVIVKDLINSYIGFSFLINNLKVTEEGVKKIVDELVLYADDEANIKYKKFYEVENLGNFGSYYYNYDYIDPNDDKNKITFVLSGLEYGEGSLPGIQFDDEFSVVSIRDRLTKEILNKKFENLKTTYCPKRKTEEKKQACVEYMDYLKSLSPSALDAELEHITMIYSMKKYSSIKRDVYTTKAHYYYYNNLSKDVAKKEGKNSALSQYFKDLYSKNGNIIGQCTWYIGLLKRTDKGSGPAISGAHGKDVASRYGNLGYPTDKFDPRKESAEQILRKIQVGDVISFNGRNSWRGYCVRSGDALKYGHVAIVIDKNENKKTITLGEANMHGTFTVQKKEYPVKKLCNGTVAHGVPWAY